MQCPKCSQIAFVVKEKFTNLIWRSSFGQFFYFVQIIKRVKSTDFNVPRTDSPSSFFKVLFIPWSYRYKKYTNSTFFPLVKTFVRLMMISISLPFRQRDIPVFKYKLSMVPMWVICNSNILQQLKTKINNSYVDWPVTL